MNIIPISFLQQPTAYSALTPSTGSMRSLLSAAGQAAFDATLNNSWFTASAADYAAVLAGVGGASTIGMTTAQVNTGSVSAFVGTYGITLPQANSTVPSGSYVVGLAVRGFSATAANFRPYVATTFKGTYSTLGANGITGSATASAIYFLRKNPTAQTTASYVAIGPRNSGGGNWASTGTWPAGAGYSANMSSWTNWTSATPIQQWIISTSQP